MKIIYINNAGILVDWGEGKLLVDAIQFYKSRFSDPLPEDLWSDMLEGEGPLRHADFLGATHIHPDHISTEGVADYIFTNNVRRLFLPALSASDVMERVGEPVPDLTVLTEEGGSEELTGQARISWFKTAHVGPQFRFVQNYCFEIASGSKRLLILGDAEPDRDVFEENCWGSYDAVAVNPMFFNDANGKLILKEVLNASTVILYHMPTPEPINMVLRRQTDKQIQRWADIFDRLVVLEQPYDSVSI